jgi:hypothetical protein
MKLDPVIHIVMHLVFFGKAGVTYVEIEAIFGHAMATGKHALGSGESLG